MSIPPSAVATVAITGGWFGIEKQSEPTELPLEKACQSADQRRSMVVVDGNVDDLLTSMAR
ncbi:hypothetical protein [endosymbiont of Lamellibrachia barhami]|uniref:hypothetical protein n=1 Tax=endosymbiont of Lamellibrachia barhami TaxID=205975 RepID=UPI0015B2D93A|nr:hypothetical protein [endosymbiont of Lamellibrachia barhami]